MTRARRAIDAETFGATQHEWNDWHWQQRHRIRDLETLERYLPLRHEEREGLRDTAFRFSITPYYLSLIDPEDPRDPIRRQAIPLAAELAPEEASMLDPLAEDVNSPVPALVHRYPDRALLYATHHCPVYCRYCFRKRKVGDPASAPERDLVFEGIDYVARTPAIRDVLVSGGDPLSLSDDRLVAILERLRRIPHLDVIRIATRNPVTLPMRITSALAAMLADHHPIYVNTHFNHPRECTEDAAEALRTLADAGCVLGNQMVLLQGVNDEVETVRELNRWLLRQRCKPYYMFQCDPAPGTQHFRTPIRKGIEIIEGLRGHMSGMAVPHYVVDLPGGGGRYPCSQTMLWRKERGAGSFATMKASTSPIESRLACQ